MQVADIRLHLQDNFAVVFSEFTTLCGSNTQAAMLLSKLFYWTKVIEHERHRNGWLYKSAQDLKNELGLTRRGYEKARSFLLGLGVVQYRRGGVHAKMHWRVNLEKLFQLIYTKVKGKPVPEWTTRFNQDKDGFNLQKWIPIDLWDQYLKVRKEKGSPVTYKQKKALFNQLKALKEKNLDLRQIMEKSILAGWKGFYDSSTWDNTCHKPSSNNAPAIQCKYPNPDYSTYSPMADIAAKRAKRNAPPTVSEPITQKTNGRTKLKHWLDVVNHKVHQNMFSNIEQKNNKIP